MPKKYYLPAAIALTAVLLGAFLFDTQGTSDAQAWLSWVDNAESDGLVGGFALNAEDYPPLTTLLLWLATRIGALAGHEALVSIKTALAALLIATAVVHYCFSRDALVSSLVLLFPVIDTVGLVYTDILPAPFLVAALFLMTRRRWTAFTVCYTLACLTKWQHLILGPFLAVTVLLAHRDTNGAVRWRAIFTRCGLPAAAILLALLAAYGGPLGLALQKALSNPTLSGQAFNLCWILTWIVQGLDPATFNPTGRMIPFAFMAEQRALILVPKAVFFVLYLGLLWEYSRVRGATLLDGIKYALLGYLCYFFFSPGVHENHLFVAALVLGVIAARDRSWLKWFVVWAAIFNANITAYYGLDGVFRWTDPRWWLLGVPHSVWASALCTLGFVYFYRKTSLRIQRGAKLVA